MNSGLLKNEDLLEWFNVKQQAKLKRCLRECNIAYHFDGEGNPITALDSISASLSESKQDEVDF